MPADWVVPDWPAPANIRSLITTRNGGVSQGPFAGQHGSGGMNPGLRCGDAVEFVQANRALLRKYLPAEPCWLKQVHGTTLVAAHAPPIRGHAGYEEPEADGSYTHKKGRVCVVMAADCLPVLLTNLGGHVVAAVHAGWRGLAAGVLENAVKTLQETLARYAIPVEQRTLMAYCGPAIGPTAFEVGAEVRQAFTTVHADAAAYFAAHPSVADKYFADIVGLAKLRLGHAGVTQCYGGGLCTVNTPARFYSYRRDQVTGRMAALIWIDDYANLPAATR
ncbi:peptidoglycan editing factor PgeF [Parvibium lacunae]|uniref:Purine nucleoside phosphorylase n=2 Tax=Parvibium lacunae TaxID=1888893 RepID=A0A368L8F6_9BURK|nr:peptidoglycan editing factor PgeF [Parvibium lacunae]